MPVEVIGLDHVFVAVRDLGRSRIFYDRVMPVLGFRRGEGNLGGDPHVFYHNRQLVYALRPAGPGSFAVTVPGTITPSESPKEP